MFNLHVGIPGIVPDLLHSVVHAGLLKIDDAPAVLSRQLWQKQFRGLVNAKRKNAALDAAAWRWTEAAISDLSAYDTVAVSQHALLGGPEDCFLKPKVLPYTDARIARVSEIFAAVPLTFHLTIQSQFDYLHATMARLLASSDSLQRGIVPSWSGLVRRIRAAAPDRKIVVWDFEQPEKVALAFMVCLLEVHDTALIKALEAHLYATLKRPGSPIGSNDIPGMPQEMIDRLDAQYDLDLQDLGKIEGVSLIVPDSISEEFHIRPHRKVTA